MLINLVWLFLYISQINGDAECSIADHPYMVAIFYNANNSLRFLGSGTLLSPRWVLSSRVPSFHEEAPQNYTMIAGATSLEEIKSRRFVLDVIFHSVITIVYDIFQLHRANVKVHKSMTVSYVHLATSKDFRNKRLEDICANATMIGYNAQINDGIKSQPLQCTQISLISQNLCQKKLPNKKLSSFMTCVARPNVDISSGNPGGPVMCNGIQYGIVPANYGGRPNDPSIFLKLDHYENFIRSHVKLESGQVRESKCSSNHSIHLFVLILSFIFYLITA